MMLRIDTRKHSSSFLGNSKLVGALILLSLTLGLSQESDASTGSKWTLPSSGDTESSSRTYARASRDSDSPVSPFSPGSNNLALDLGQVFLMGDLTKYDDSIG